MFYVDDCLAVHNNIMGFLQMNLASQSVLEGLNACLDHRGEVILNLFYLHAQL